MVSAYNVPKPIETSKFPCCVCNEGVVCNSIRCLVCDFWVHKCCSNIKGPIKPNPDFKRKKCRGEVSNATIPDIQPVDINGEEIKKVRSFCYLRNFIGQGGGCFRPVWLNG